MLRNFALLPVHSSPLSHKILLNVIFTFKYLQLQPHPSISNTRDLQTMRMIWKETDPNRSHGNQKKTVFFLAPQPKLGLGHFIVEFSRSLRRTPHAHHTHTTRTPHSVELVLSQKYILGIQQLNNI